MKVWNVPVTYSSRPYAQGTGNPADVGKDNPVDWEWKVSGSFASYLKAVTKDWNGTAVLNSADEPFIPLPEQDDPRDVLVLEKNTANIDLSVRKQFRGAVNSLPIWGLDAREAKLMQWEFQVCWNGIDAYISNRFEIHIQYGGWLFQPLDQGFREKVGIVNGLNDYREITVRGERIRTPALLDGAGARLLAGNNPVFFDGAGGNPAAFEIEPEKDFFDLFPGLLPGPFVN